MDRSPEKSEKDKFLEAMSAVSATSSLTQGFHGTKFEHSAEPLKLATITFLKEADLSVEEEFKLIKVFVKRFFDFTQIGADLAGHFGGQKWGIGYMRECLSFIQLARQRYVQCGDDSFWHGYLQLIASEAAKHLHPLRKGVSKAANVRDKEEAKEIIEAINKIVPIAEMDAHRKGFSEQVHAVILDDVESAYVYGSRDMETVRQNAEKYNINIPTAEQYWEDRARTAIVSLQAEAEKLRIDKSDAINCAQRIRQLAELRGGIGQM